MLTATDLVMKGVNNDDSQDGHPSTDLLLPARRYASAGTSYGPIYLFIYLIIESMFVLQTPVLYRNGCTGRAGFCVQVSLEICYTVF